MLVEKEVIAPGDYWYVDESTGVPRKLAVNAALTKYWHDQGSQMLAQGLTIPVPYEHDFTAHPMTPKEKLLNNAGEVKEYRLKGDALWSVVDVQDPDVKSKIGRSIRWTSPWINSFTDGTGKKWNNVISHLALTTRPRITKQQPFDSVAAALSMAAPLAADTFDAVNLAGTVGFCLSRAGRLASLKRSGRVVPRYPVAFSMWAGGVPLGEAPPFAKKKTPPGKAGGLPDKAGGPPGKGGADAKPGAKPGAAEGGDGEGDSYEDGDENPAGEGGDEDQGGIANPLVDANGDIGMEELLCDLLQALGVPMPDESNENEFKRHLYEAVMSKIKELTSDGMGKEKFKPDQNKPPGQQPNASKPVSPNPLLQQEQQPMYMGLAMNLEEINKLPEPMRGVALAMYAENQKLRSELEANGKITASLRDAKLEESGTARAARISLLGKISPKVKADLEAMQANASMALSMGDGGKVIDPMDQVLSILEKSLSDLPRLLTTESAALAIHPHPKDGDELTAEQEDEIAEAQARRMGAPPVEKKKSA